MWANCFEFKWSDRLNTGRRALTSAPLVVALDAHCHTGCPLRRSALRACCHSSSRTQVKVPNKKAHPLVRTGGSVLLWLRPPALPGRLNLAAARLAFTATSARSGRGPGNALARSALTSAVRCARVVTGSSRTQVRCPNKKAHPLEGGLFHLGAWRCPTFARYTSHYHRR